MGHLHHTPFTLSTALDGLAPEEVPGRYQRITRCPSCQLSLEGLVRWLKALDHWDPVVGPEYVTRHEVFARLLDDYPHKKRLKAIRGDGLFHQWGLAKLLLEVSTSCRNGDPAESSRSAELALEVANNLDPGFYRSRRVADLRALAAANYGDSLRVLGRSEEAATSLRCAEEWLQGGTRRAWIVSEVATLKSHLLRDLGRNQRALKLLRQAIVAHEQPVREPLSLFHWLVQPRSPRVEDGSGEAPWGA